VGQFLNATSALSAYSINIGFGLAGVLVFTALSFLRTGPLVWMVVSVLALFPFFYRSVNAWILVSIPIACVLLPSAYSWSPYYRIDIEQVSARAATGEELPYGYTVHVNHDGICGAYNLDEQFTSRLSGPDKAQLIDYYNPPYRIFEPGRFQKVLVLGSGAGNDVAAALRNGAAHVDAVEIDPAIIEIGAKYHPEKPYHSPRVTTFNANAR